MTDAKDEAKELLESVKMLRDGDSLINGLRRLVKRYSIIMRNHEENVALPDKACGIIEKAGIDYGFVKSLHTIVDFYTDNKGKSNGEDKTIEQILQEPDVCNDFKFATTVHYDKVKTLESMQVENHSPSTIKELVDDFERRHDEDRGRIEELQKHLKYSDKFFSWFMGGDGTCSGCPLDGEGECCQMVDENEEDCYKNIVDGIHSSWNNNLKLKGGNDDISL